MKMLMVMVTTSIPILGSGSHGGLVDYKMETKVLVILENKMLVIHLIFTWL